MRKKPHSSGPTTSQTIERAVQIPHHPLTIVEAPLDWENHGSS
jgi:hypothetical protein